MTSKPTRVLFVLPDLTDPPSRGYEVRASSLADQLRTRFTVELMTADGRPATQYVQHRRLASLQSAAYPLARKWPLQTALFDGPKVAKRALRAAMEWKPGVVVIFTERLPFTTTAMAEHFPVVLDVVDSMHLHMAERASRASPLFRWFWRLEADRFARLAGKLGHVARTVVASTASAKSQYPEAVIIPNASSMKRQARPVPKFDLIFAGNLWYWPNVEATRLICEVIVPLVRHRLPESRLLIAGRSPSARVRMLCLEANVTLMADVPDMGELLASSRLALAPLEWAGGGNLKIADALAVGTPVLAFRTAANQLPHQLGGVVICDSAEEMARIAIEFLSSEGDPLPLPATSGWRDGATVLGAIIDSLREQTSVPSPA